MIHMLVRPRNEAQEVWGSQTHESDRAAFLGRGRSALAPIALTGTATRLRGNCGEDRRHPRPDYGIGTEIDLSAHATVQLAIVTLAAPSRKAALDLAQRYRAWTRSAARSIAPRRRRTGTAAVGDDDENAGTDARVAVILAPSSGRDAGGFSDVQRQLQGQSGLWPYRHSVTRPILLLCMNDETQRWKLQDLLRAHTYWRRRGLNIDLVIFNRQTTSYGAVHAEFHPPHDSAHRQQQLAESARRHSLCCVTIRWSEADRTLLHSVARVVLDSANGPLAEQTVRASALSASLARL